MGDETRRTTRIAAWTLAVLMVGSVVPGGMVGTALAAADGSSTNVSLDATAESMSIAPGTSTTIAVTIDNFGEKTTYTVEPTSVPGGWSVSDDDFDPNGYKETAVSKFGSKTLTFRVDAPSSTGSGSITFTAWYQEDGFFNDDERAGRVGTTSESITVEYQEATRPSISGCDVDVDVSGTKIVAKASVSDSGGSGLDTVTLRYTDPNGVTKTQSMDKGFFPPSKHSASFTGSSLETYDVEVEAIDNAGNSKTACSRTKTLEDTVKPSISNVDVSTSGKTVTVEAEVTDDGGLDQVQLHYDGGWLSHEEAERMRSQSGDEYEGSFQADYGSSGKVYVSATDTGDNSQSTSESSYTVEDTAKPSISNCDVDVDETTATVSADLSDPGLGIQSATLHYSASGDSGTASMDDGLIPGGPWGAEFTADSYDSFDVHVTVTDEAGNTARGCDESGRMHDTRSPTVRIRSIDDSSTQVEVTAEVTDAGEGVDPNSVTLYSDTGFFSGGPHEMKPAGGNTYEATFDANPDESGSVYVEAADTAGNSAQSNSRDFHVADNVAPTIENCNVDIDGTQATISADVSDSGTGLASVELVYNVEGQETQTKPMTTGPFGTGSHTVSFVGDSSDPFTLHVEATDEAGNDAEACDRSRSLQDERPPSVRIVSVQTRGPEVTVEAIATDAGVGVDPSTLGVHTDNGFLPDTVRQMTPVEDDTYELTFDAGADTSDELWVTAEDQHGNSQQTDRQAFETGQPLELETSRTRAPPNGPVHVRAQNLQGLTVDWTITAPAGEHERKTRESGNYLTVTFDTPGFYTVTADAPDGRTASTTIDVEEANQDLLEKFAPVATYHADEKFKPVRYETFVQHSKLKEVTVDPSNNGPSPPITNTLEDEPTVLDLDREVQLGSKLHLQLQGSVPEIAGSDDEHPPSVYAAWHEDIDLDLAFDLQVDDQTWDIATYAFFYIFDPKQSVDDFDPSRLASHPTDVEKISILFESDGSDEPEPQWVAASQHFGGELRTWEQTPKQSTHPKIYPALGAHSNYFHDGTEYKKDDLIPQPQFWGEHLSKICNPVSNPAPTDPAVTSRAGLEACKSVDRTGGGPTIAPVSADGDETYEIIPVLDQDDLAFEGRITDQIDANDGFKQLKDVSGFPFQQSYLESSPGEWIDQVHPVRDQVDAGVELLDYEPTQGQLVLDLANDGAKPHTFHVEFVPSGQSSTTSTIDVPAGALTTQRQRIPLEEIVPNEDEAPGSLQVKVWAFDESERSEDAKPLATQTIDLSTPEEVSAVYLVHGFSPPPGEPGTDTGERFSTLQDALGPNQETHTVGYYACDQNADVRLENFGSPVGHIEGPIEEVAEPVDKPADLHSPPSAYDCRDRPGINSHDRSTLIQHLGYHFAHMLAERHGADDCSSIVAHSMGGLIVRYALTMVQRGHEDFPSPDDVCVQSVVTAGTPHQGSQGLIAAEGCSAFTDLLQCQQMIPDSGFLQWLDARDGPAVEEGPYDWFALGSASDDQVSPESATGIDVPDRFYYQEPPSVTPNPNLRPPAINHGDYLGLTDDELAYRIDVPNGATPEHLANFDGVLYEQFTRSPVTEITDRLTSDDQSEPTNIEDEITVEIFDPPTGSLETGDKATTKVEISNDDDQDHELFLGYGVRPQTSQDWLDNGGTTGFVVTVPAGGSTQETVTWPVSSESPRETYDVLVRVWEETDRSDLENWLDEARRTDQFEVVDISPPSITVQLEGAQETTVGDPATLQTVVSPDVKPADLSYHWKLEESTAGSTSAVTSLPSGPGGQASFSKPGTYVVEVEVDGPANSATANMEITVVPTDPDGDGVPTPEDDCPDQPGPASNAGCPAEAEVAIVEVRTPDGWDRDTSQAATVSPGDTRSFDVVLENTGSSEGTQQLSLTAGATTLDTRNVNVPAGQTRTVTLEATFESLGEHEVRVGETDLGTVLVEPLGSFSVERLSVPEEPVRPGQTATIEAVVANDGTTVAEGTARLKVAGQTVREESLSLPSAASRMLTVDHTLQKTGDRGVRVQVSGSGGSLTEQVTVSVRDDPPTPSLSFEGGEVGSTTPPDPWYVKNGADKTSGKNAHIVTDSRATDGDKSYHVASYGDRTPIEIAVDADLTNVSTIFYDGYVEANNPINGDIRLSVDGESISNDLVGRSAQEPTDEDPPENRWYHDVEADVSDFTGEHTLYFWVRGEPNDAYYDNFRFLDASGDAIDPSQVVVRDDEVPDDSDDDGVPDPSDACPEQPADTPDGCPDDPSASIEVASVDLPEQPLDIGQSAPVTVVVENTGQAAGQRTISVATNGEPFVERGVQLDPGQQTTITAEVSYTDPGEHPVTVDETRQRTIEVRSSSGPQLRVADATVARDQTTTVPVYVEDLSDGVSGFEATIQVDDPSVARIADASLASELKLSSIQVAADGSSVELQGADVQGNLQDAIDQATVATITLEGRTLGETRVGLSVSQADNDTGAAIDPRLEAGTLTVHTCGPTVYEGKAPTDPDGDGLCEDLNGNQRVDFHDLRVLFLNLLEPAITDYATSYDFNDNGRMDFDDLRNFFENEF